MLLTIDIGNTSATCGLWTGNRLMKRGRVPMGKPAAKVVSRIIKGVHSVKLDGICISSVVPWIDRTLAYRLKRLYQCPVIFANKKTVGIRVDRRIGETVGADRLVNALAGWERYWRSLIIVDFGTATTFDVVDERGMYAGGAIAPGILLANRSLTDYTAKLPRVDIAKTRCAICYTTKTAMQSGVFHGYVGLVEHMIAKIKGEMKSKPIVIATGGLARLIASEAKHIDRVHPELTLEGLRYVWEHHQS